MSAQWLPKGFHTITPNIIVDDAEEAVAFLKKALGATENYRLTTSDGTIAHCELKIGDSTLNLGTSMEGWPAHGLVFGSREGRIADPFGNVWTIATLKEEVAVEEMQRRMKAEGY
jgi:PhnB protein